MLTILETLWRLVVLVTCALVQFIAAILGDIGMLFSMAGEHVRKFSGNVLHGLDGGKYEAKMRDIAK